MSTSSDRRSFLSTSALGLGGLAVLNELPAVSAAEARLNPASARLDSEIEPLVRFLEETPRAKLLEEVAARIKKGLPYRDVLAALLLAGVRTIEPHPLGFQFHCVLMVNAGRQASLAAPDKERWLPVLWNLDYWKQVQEKSQEKGGWRLKPVDEAKVPPARQAREAFIKAMDDWDVAAADAAAAAVARSLPANEAFDLFARFGCRDFRDIGHKAIYVASSFRTLQTIGWHHAEPILRGLALGLMEHEGDNPSKRDAEQDRPGRRNAELIRKTPRPGWLDGKPVAEAPGELLAASRTISADDMCDEVLKLIDRGVSVRSVWDGLFVSAAELLMRWPGIVGVHPLTTMNALFYAFQTTSDDSARQLLLLQAASFLPLFREAFKKRGKMSAVQIDALEPADKSATPEETFAEITKDRASAARMALSCMKADPAGARKLVDAGRLLVFLKGNEPHDYKFSSSVMEDYRHVAPAWRDRFLAASLYWLRGSDMPDSPTLKRTRAALA